MQPYAELKQIEIKFNINIYETVRSAQPFILTKTIEEEAIMIRIANKIALHMV